MFDNPVTILLAGVTGPVGYRSSGSATWQTITNVCGGAYDTPTAPTAPGECSISNGTDTKIVTYHFTSFGSLVATPTPAPTPVSPGSGGGGGGSGYYYSPTLAPTPAGVPQGQVLGATTFNFTSNLTNGSSNNDVAELQKRLTQEGFYNGRITGYFGPLTSQAVKAYQIKKGLPGTGFVGPLTRTQLNSGQVLGVSTSAEAETIKAQITILQTQLVVLLQKLAAALQSQATH